MFRIKFQVEFLETFSQWKVVEYIKHADLGVIGAVGPLCSVTVKRWGIFMIKTVKSVINVSNLSPTNAVSNIDVAAS